MEKMEMDLKKEFDCFEFEFSILKDLCELTHFWACDMGEHKDYRNILCSAIYTINKEISRLNDVYNHNLIFPLEQS